MYKIKHISLSPSAIALFKACPQKFNYSYLRRRSDRILDMSNLSSSDWGTVMHRHLANFYSGRGYVPSGETLLDFRFKEYLLHYKHDVVGQYSVEVTRRVPFRDRISLMGTADLVDEHNRTIWDHKTSARMSPSDSAKWAMRDQFKHYGFLMGWLDGFSVIVNQISSAKNPENKFQRYQFDVTSRDMGDFISRTEVVSRQILDLIETQTAWLYKNAGDACGDYGGCYFKDSCQLGLYTPEGLGEDLTNEHFELSYERESC